MLARTIDADQSKDKFNMTISGIDKMDLAIKEELENREKLAGQIDDSNAKMINSVRIA